NPALIRYQIGLGGLLGDLGLLLLDREEPAEGRRLLEQGRDHDRSLLERMPKSPQALQDFRRLTVALGRTLLDSGDHARAAGLARERSRLDPKGADSQAESGRLLAHCARVVGHERHAESAVRAASYADESFAALRRAVEQGYAAYTGWGHDPDLESLRSRPDFQALL